MNGLLNRPRGIKGWFCRNVQCSGNDFGLTLEAAAVEKGLLLGRGGAAEHGVAVREAAEPADDVGVQLRPFQQVGVAGRGKQRAASLLVGQGLGMLERQVEKLPSGDGTLPVEAARQRPLGDGAGQRIGGVGARIAAEHVARELVEHDGERQRAFGGLLPVGKLSGRGRLVGFKEARADVVVEGRVLLEPFFRAGLAPERQHGFGRGNHSRTSPLSIRR